MRLRCSNWRSGAGHASANRLANRSEGHHVPRSPFRCPPPRPRPVRRSQPLIQAWLSLPTPRRQEVVLVLSQVIARWLPTAPQKEAGREHP